MKGSNFFKSLGLAFFAYATTLSANTLLDTANFNVTLNLAPSHYLTVGDLDFGYVNPATLSPDATPIESTTTTLVAYSNATAGHYVTIVASDPKYLSQDGYSFLMLGKDSNNNDSIPFILNTSYNEDGTPAKEGVRQILPGYNIVAVDGTDRNHKAIRDLWASVRSNNDVKNATADAYLSVLTANHYSNQ